MAFAQAGHAQAACAPSTQTTGNIACSTIEASNMVGQESLQHDLLSGAIAMPKEVVGKAQQPDNKGDGKKPSLEGFDFRLSNTDDDSTPAE